MGHRAGVRTDVMTYMQLATKMDYIEAQAARVRGFPDYAPEAMGKIIQTAMDVLREIEKDATK